VHLLQIDDNRGDVTLVRAALKDVATPVRLTVVQDGHAAKAPALHPVNPTLVTAGKGSLPAVVIHEVKEAELDERWSCVGGKKQARWL
jgi:hypothetical protein